MRHLSRAELLIVLAIILLVLSLSPQTLVPSPITYPDSPFAVTPPVVHPGENINVIVRRCNGYPLTIALQIAWEIQRRDSLRVALSPGVASAKPGCFQGDGVETIPKDTPPGIYHVVRLTSFNSVAGHYDVESESQEFTVE